MGLVIGTDSLTGYPVELDEEARSRGLHIIGTTGSGKTTAIERFVLQDVRARHGVAVLDPHGDLVDRVLMQTPADRASDVVILDPADWNWPFGINLYSCSDPSNPELVGRLLSQIVELFEKLWGAKGSEGSSWGPRLAQYMRNSALPFLLHPGFSMAEIPALLRDPGFRHKVLEAASGYGSLLDFWTDYDQLGPRVQNERADSTLNKLDEFLSQPVVRNIVGQAKATVDFRGLMDQGKILLIRLRLGKLGEPPVQLLGSMLVLLLLNAALSREELPPSERRPFYLYVDEYQRFSTPAFATLLTEARKYRVSTTIAHQFLGQLDEQNREAAANTANKIIFSVTGRDAEQLAKEFDHTPPPPEVVGRRPILTVSPEPVAQLCRHDHKLRRVREDVDGLLRPLWNTSQELANGEAFPLHPFGPGRKAFFRDSGWYYAPKETLLAGIHQLDAHLKKVMEGSLAVGTEEHLRDAFAVLIRLRAFWGISPADWAKPDYRSSVWPEGNKFPHEWRDVTDLPAESLDSLWHLWRTNVTDGSPRRAEYISASVGFRAARDQYWRKSINGVYLSDQQREHYATARGAFEARNAQVVCTQLASLVKQLASSPVLIDSGQWEPVYERARAYSDVEAEVATRLVNQRQFEANCKVSVDGAPREFRIKTPTFEILDEAHSFALVEQMRDRSRTRHSRPRQEVEMEIARRVQGFKDDKGPARIVQLIP